MVHFARAGQVCVLAETGLVYSATCLPIFCMCLLMCVSCGVDSSCRLTLGVSCGVFFSRVIMYMSLYRGGWAFVHSSLVYHD